MTLRTLLIVGIAALTCGAASAASTLYDRSMNVKVANGWVSPKVAIVFDAKGAVTVVDSVILGVIGKPIPAKVRRSNCKLRITWTISGAEDTGGERIPRFSYLALINESSKVI